MSETATIEKQSKRSLKGTNHRLSEANEQLAILEKGPFINEGLDSFVKKLSAINLYPLKPLNIDVFQMNIGYMCNQTCAHCHVDAGPDRKEVMIKETMEQCLEVIKTNKFKTVDITGGAPEMNPHFRWFVESLSEVGVEDIIVRCNLTIILANKKYQDLPAFFAKNKVHVVSSLPFYQKRRTDNQRGEGVFNKSIEALKLLNAVGYGKEGSGLVLDLVYNPSGAFLPAPQEQLETDYKRELKRLFDVEFNHLFSITNLPISRYLDYLIATDNYNDYMEMLVDAFNPSAAENVMCRNTISVDWQGYLYDCDFNQMLDLKVESSAPQHVKDWNQQKMEERNIIVNNHCFGCTAGAGSSCQGTVA